VLDPKSSTKFILLAAAFLALMLYPWPGWKERYAIWFRKGGNAVFSRFWFWPDASARFLDLDSPNLADEALEAARPLAPTRGLPLPPADKVKDTLVLMKNVNKERPGLGMTRTSSRPIGYWPTAVVIALVFATPLGWSRRLIALLAGLIIVQVFVVGRLTVILLKNGFADPMQRCHVIAPGAFGQRLLKGLDEVVADNPTFNFVAPVFIWLGVIVVGRWITRRRAGPPLTPAKTAA
jgi:hypothetical protein